MEFVTPFHPKDHLRMEQWLRWVGELGGNKAGHGIILMPAKDVTEFSALQFLAEAAFERVSVLHDAEGINGHPEGPNSMMRQALWHCQVNDIGPWTFMENDCIPLVPDWRDQWEREYRAFGKPFMGELRPAQGVVPDYLTGNMVLPKGAILLAPMLSRRGLSVDGVELAFDIVSAGQVLPQAHLTKLLHQVPKNPDGSSHSFPDQESLKLLRPGAVLFHPCKDGSLIARLREKLSGTNGNSAAASAPEQSGDGASCGPSLTPPRLSSEAQLRAENALLLKRIQKLESDSIAIPPRLAHHFKPKPKKQRTAQEQAKINARMEKARAGRGRKLTGVA